MDHDEGVPGAETRAAFATRVYAAVDGILARPAERQVVVTPGFALTFVVASWIGMPLASTGYVNLRATSGGITELAEDAHFDSQVVRVDDVGHLDRVRAPALEIWHKVCQYLGIRSREGSTG